jgi:hypothetical protein
MSIQQPFPDRRDQPIFLQNNHIYCDNKNKYIQYLSGGTGNDPDNDMFVCHNCKEIHSFKSHNSQNVGRSSLPAYRAEHRLHDYKLFLHIHGYQNNPEELFM